MINKLKKILIKLKNLFINNIEDLKIIKEKNYISEIQEVESNLELLAKYRKHGERMYSCLKRHTEVLNIYCPTVTNQEIKLLFETRLVEIENFSINFNRAMFLLEKLETKFDQKLKKLRNKKDIEDNYELTIELKTEYDLFFAMYKAMNFQYQLNALRDTFKILNLTKKN